MLENYQLLEVKEMETNLYNVIEWYKNHVVEVAMFGLFFGIILGAVAFSNHIRIV